MATTEEINNILSVLKGYVGAFPKDNLPKLNLNINTTKYIVINTDPSYKSGEHWLGLVFTKNECLYFDSYGLEILDRHILNYIKKSGYNVYKYSEKCVQPWHSNQCAYYVICFIISMYHGESYEKFISHFKNIRTNDYTIISMLKTFKLF